MNYLYWLLGISAAFAVLEKLRPARSQPQLRRGLVLDLFYLVFHGHLYWLLFGSWITLVAQSTQSSVRSLGWDPAQNLAGKLPFAAQFVVILLASDFLQWCVHNLLHRIPLLWRFHQVHHSVTTMDWAGNFRFHWVEVILYRSLLYLPSVLLGGSPEAIFWVAVFATAWGHFNHSNINLGLGPLAYLMNSPKMHLWHHDLSTEGGPAKNFGIVFSLWDWLFRTAYWPRERPPERIGFSGMESMPFDLPRQLLWPLWPRRSRS